LFFDYLIALLGTLTAFVVWHSGGALFRWVGLKIGRPLIEAPYEDFSRGMPSRIRFLRLPIKSMFGGVKNVRVSMEVKQESGKQVDVPGILHWQRQPRSGIPHPQELHQKLKDGRDMLDHMYRFHFAANSPIDIDWRQQDKVDLLMKVEGISKASPTITRESGLDPGKYWVKVMVKADNAWQKSKEFRLEIGEGVEDMKVLSL